MGVPHITVKVVGYQWYWYYEIVHYINLRRRPLNPKKPYRRRRRVYIIEFDSYIIEEEDLLFGDLRLLEVTQSLKLPANVPLRIVFTGADVIHSWAVPALGVKIDCVPGRLNATPVFITHPVVMYGQCSELCGILHGFIPICVVAI
jgi:cytochrome c oxidase subunit 2